MVIFEAVVCGAGLHHNQSYFGHLFIPVYISEGGRYIRHTSHYDAIQFNCITNQKFQS